MKAKLKDVIVKPLVEMQRKLQQETATRARISVTVDANAFLQLVHELDLKPRSEAASSVDVADGITVAIGDRDLVRHESRVVPWVNGWVWHGSGPPEGPTGAQIESAAVLCDAWAKDSRAVPGRDAWSFGADIALIAEGEFGDPARSARELRNGWSPSPSWVAKLYRLPPPHGVGGPFPGTRCPNCISGKMELTAGNLYCDNAGCKSLRLPT